ncbi:MAG TPA: EAL domain-containing protein [Pseudonocardia sp.]|jgi:diguanylate cyclase (GGDEF)-like protein/PAS domain S-box-containing protein|uniref:putative bifunctional diguanylate cyclase/phosphodiesterase n=1 Tax=Pseudonocardia sp. TaxID=60912 RepID=UPI002F407204
MSKRAADSIPSPVQGSGPLPKARARGGARHSAERPATSTPDSPADILGTGARPSVGPETSRGRARRDGKAAHSPAELRNPAKILDPEFDQGTEWTPGPVTSVAESLSLPAAPTLLCDSSDRVLRVNAALLRMAGRDPRQQGAGEGLLGFGLDQLLVGPDNDARLVRPDGALVRVKVVRWNLPDLGPLTGLRAVLLVDATEAAPAVTSKDDNDQRIAELQRLAKIGSWSYDLRSGGLHRGPALVELYRQTGIAPDSQPKGPIELEQVALLCAALRDPATRSKPGGPDGHHIEHRTAPPGERVLSCRARVERNSEGTAVRLVGTVQDITDRRLAEQRMERATQRYLDLVAIAPVGVAVFNRAGRLVDANAAACTLLSSSGEQLRGVSARSLSVEPAGSDELAFLRPVRAGSQHGYRIPEYAVRRADSTTVWCELSVTVSIGDDGRPFWLVVFTDISERRRAADVLRIAGTHDELTRLPNRSALTARLSRLLAGPDRAKLAVLCCDLDDFKRVNTALGHAAGDQVLIMLAARLQRELPVGCTPARLSGDEFVVVCDDVEAVGGVPQLAESVAALLRAPLNVDGQPVRVSAAIGAATSADGVGSLRGTPTAEDLMRFADAAMYDAKQRGAGQLALLSAEAASSANNQLRLEDELREAIVNDQLVLHYQPVVGPDGAVRSAEALVRWPHPERGMLPPGKFIPVAERGGLMRDLDRWVLRTAAKEAATWPTHQRRPVGVAVNLAGLLPGDRDFVPTVRSALAESGLPGDRLVLELVETSLVSLPQRTLAAMSEIAAMGVRFAVDDFGTGYSSLSRIKELPAQIVKVDRTFVDGISTDPADFAVARAVVQMASAMGRYCVAEGVETAEQFHALRSLGVDAYQGWLFAKALEPKAFRAVLEGPPMPLPPGEPGPPPDGLATQALPTRSANTI